MELLINQLVIKCLIV